MAAPVVSIVRHLAKHPIHSAATHNLSGKLEAELLHDISNVVVSPLVFLESSLLFWQHFGPFEWIVDRRQSQFGG